MNLELKELIRTLLLRRENELGNFDGLKEGSPRWIETKVKLLSHNDTIDDILKITEKQKEKNQKKEK